MTAWCLLAFVVSIVGASGLGGAALTTALALAYIAAMWFFARPLMRRFGARVGNREGLTQNVVATVLVLLLLSSLTTEWIGIHALFGAFMFGVIMPREGNFIRVLAEKIEDIVLVLLLPLFFAYSGLRTEIGLLSTWSDWLTCGLITVVACLGKFGGSAIAARLLGVDWRQSVVLGVLVNTRGLMELVVLNIGFDLGVIGPELFTMMVIMALVTTVMTTPLLAWLYPPHLRVRVEPAGEDTVRRFNVLMCVAYDSSGPGLARMAHALTAGSVEATGMYALRVLPPTDRASFYVEGEAGEAAALAPLMHEAELLRRQVRPLVFVSAKPAEEICDVARTKQADVIVLGWHKPLLGQAVLGGTVRQVMQQARSPVGVFIDRGLQQVRKVLVAYGGSPHDMAALALARRLRDNAGADVTVLHVIDAPRATPTANTMSNVEAVFARADPQTGSVYFKAIAHRDAAQAILQEASRGYDVVVVGVGAEWGLDNAAFGWRQESLIKSAPTSLLIVHGTTP